MKNTTGFFLPVTLAFSCVLITTPARSFELPSSEWTAVEAVALQGLRGGFNTESGLRISFGVERTVSVNGETASTMSFNADDIGKLVSGQAAPDLPGKMVELIQNGPGNIFQAGSLSSTAAATFIQNTLNDQTIRSLTIVSTTTNSLEILKGMNMQSVLHDALVNAAAIR